MSEFVGACVSDPAPQIAASVTEEPLYAVPTRSDRIGRIVAPVSINGQGPFYFMLDTGATHTVMTEAAALRLGLTATAAASMVIHGVSGTAVYPTVKVAQLQAGALQFKDLQLPVLTGPVLIGLDGILGMDGLTDKKITANFIHDKIMITRSQGTPASLRNAVVHFDFVSKRLPMASASVGRIRVKAVIDTGSSHTLGNRALLQALVAAHGFDPNLLQADVVDATQTSQSGAVVRAPRINLGGVTIANTAVTFGDFHIFDRWGLEEPALLIGMDVLGTLGELTIDYRRRELHVMSRY